MNNDYNGNFKSKEEFESVIGRGCELGFEWKITNTAFLSKMIIHGFSALQVLIQARIFH